MRKYHQSILEKRTNDKKWPAANINKLKLIYQDSTKVSNSTVFQEESNFVPDGYTLKLTPKIQ
jgi:hypothetical protein